MLQLVQLANHVLLTAGLVRSVVASQSCRRCTAAKKKKQHLLSRVQQTHLPARDKDDVEENDRKNLNNLGSGKLVHSRWPKESPGAAYAPDARSARKGRGDAGKVTANPAGKIVHTPHTSSKSLRRAEAAYQAVTRHARTLGPGRISHRYVSPWTLFKPHTAQCWRLGSRSFSFS